MEQIKLDYTPPEADGLCGAPQVSLHLRHNACGVAHVQEGEVGEERLALWRHGSAVDGRMMAVCPTTAMGPVSGRTMKGVLAKNSLQKQVE